MLLDALGAAGLSPGWTPFSLQSNAFVQRVEPYDHIQLFLRNGGWATLQSYGIKGADSAPESCWREITWELIPREHVRFVKETALWHRQNGFLFIHAGSCSHIPIEREGPHELLSQYAPPRRSEIQVIGHTPTSDGEPFFEKGRINLDTGAGYGRELTACDVLTQQIWQA